MHFNKEADVIEDYLSLQVSDWDDRHKTVHWVNIPISATDDSSLTDKPLPSPAKKKVNKCVLSIRYALNILSGC